MPRPTPAELIAAAARKGGVQALATIPPVAIGARMVSGYRPDDPRTLLDHSVLVYPMVSPLLDAVLVTAGLTKLGARTYSIGLGKDADPSLLAVALDALPGCVLYADTDTTDAARRGGFRGLNRSVAASRLRTRLESTPIGRTVLRDKDRVARLFVPHPAAGPLAQVAVLVTVQTNQIYLKVCTDGMRLTGPAAADRVVELDLLTTGERREPKPRAPHSAVTLLERAAALGYVVVDDSTDGEIATLRAALADAVVARPIAGAPGEAKLIAGRNVRRRTGLPATAPGRSASTARVTAGEAVSAADNRTVAAVHPSVADVGAMALAAPTEIAVLRPYQNEVVGVHLATTKGFVDCLAPGLGKTVVSLTGMRLRAAQTPRYRSLVVCPAAIRTQWKNECERWFPEAEVLVVRKRADGEKLADALVSAGDKPLVVISSYELITSRAAVDDDPAATDPLAAVTAIVEAATRAVTGAPDTDSAAAETATGETDSAETETETETAPAPVIVSERVTEVRWHDLVVDEAAVLRNPNTLRSASLWRIRGNSDVAVALTGTPIDRNLDDLGNIVAWSRGDRELFLGVRLARRFNLTDRGQIDAFTRAVGPLVFRRDRSEVAGELPKISTEVVLLDPAEAELKLANAARSELKRIYTELMERLEAAEALNPDDPRYPEAKQALAEARGAMLGGVTLARMAASDPAALLASESAGAALLRSSGLLAAATRRTGTKRAAVCDLVSDLVGRGEKVLLFTDFSTVGEGLRADLAGRDVRTGVVMGGQSNTARDTAVAGFQNGDLDALVLTSAGREGLNLQAATVLIHYDLPWSPSAVVQRQARANRIGAVADTLQVLIPIMAGTIEERVASLLVARSVTAMAALDASRGADLAATEMGLALNGLVDAVNENEIGKKETGLLELARELLAA